MISVCPTSSAVIDEFGTHKAVYKKESCITVNWVFILSKLLFIYLFELNLKIRKLLFFYLTDLTETMVSSLCICITLTSLWMVMVSYPVEAIDCCEPQSSGNCWDETPGDPCCGSCDCDQFCCNCRGGCRDWTVRKSNGEQKTNLTQNIFVR